MFNLLNGNKDKARNSKFSNRSSSKTSDIKNNDKN
jgi:hypothetical protein